MLSNILEQRLTHNLKVIREDKGYTQQQIANFLGLTRSAYTNYELGKAAPRALSLYLLARFYKISIEDFFG